MVGLKPLEPIIASRHTTLYSSQLIYKGKQSPPSTEYVLKASASLARHTQ